MSPSAGEIVDVVAKLLQDKFRPELPEHLAFEARVAAKALELVRRELAAHAPTPAPVLSERDHLSPRDAPALDGIQLNDPTVADELWKQVLQQIAIDQPDYVLLSAERAFFDAEIE